MAWKTAAGLNASSVEPTNQASGLGGLRTVYFTGQELGEGNKGSSSAVGYGGGPSHRCTYWHWQDRRPHPSDLEPLARSA